MENENPNHEKENLSFSDEDESEEKFMDPLDKPGLLKKAKEHGLAQKIYDINEKTFQPEKTEFCECCQLPLPTPGSVYDFNYCVNIKKLSTAGIGTYLFFYFYKVLIYSLVIVLGMCSIPTVIISKNYSEDLINFCSNWNGTLDVCNAYKWNQTNPNITTDWLYKMSYQSLNSTMSIMRALNFSSTVTEEFFSSVVNYTFVNLLTMLVLFIVNCIFISDVYNRMKEADFGAVTPSDFTLMISGVSKDFKDIEELKKKHIEMNGISPSQMNLTFKIDQYFDCQNKFNIARKKYQVCVQSKRESIKSGWCCKTEETKENLKRQMKEYRQKIKDYFQEISSFNNENFNGVIFATFNYNVEYDQYFDQFPHSFIGMVFKVLHYIFANWIFCCCYSAEKKRDLSKQLKLMVERAPEPEDVIWENLQYTMTSKILRNVLVYFLSITLILISFAIVFSLNYFQFVAVSEGWTSSFVVKYTISIAVSCTVSIINYVISTSMGKLTTIEKNKSLTHFHLSYSSKLTLFTFINSAIVPLVSNVINNRGWERIDILLSNLVTIFASNAFVTPMVQLMNLFYFLRKFKQSRLEKTYKDDCEIPLYNQRELNAMYENPSMEISYKYSWVAKTFLMTVFYLPLFPLGTIISIIGVILSYMIEKFNLLRTYKRPPMLNGEICAFFINNFKLMIFTYAVGNWIFLGNVYNNNQFALPMIVLFGAIIIIPYHRFLRCQCLGQNEADILTQPYDSFYFGFSTDYERQNPLSKRKGNQQYLEKLLEQKIIDDNTYAELAQKMIKEEVNMIELYYRTKGSMDNKNNGKYKLNAQQPGYYNNLLNNVPGTNVVPTGNNKNVNKQQAFYNFIYGAGYNSAPGYSNTRQFNQYLPGQIHNSKPTVLGMSNNNNSNNVVHNENPNQNNPNNAMYTFEANNQNVQHPHVVVEPNLNSGINTNKERNSINKVEMPGYYSNSPSPLNPTGNANEANNNNMYTSNNLNTNYYNNNNNNNDQGYSNQGNNSQGHYQSYQG